MKGVSVGNFLSVDYFNSLMDLMKCNCRNSAFVSVKNIFFLNYENIDRKPT